MWSSNEIYFPMYGLFHLCDIKTSPLIRYLYRSSIKPQLWRRLTNSTMTKSSGTEALLQLLWPEPLPVDRRLVRSWVSMDASDTPPSSSLDVDVASLSGCCIRARNGKSSKSPSCWWCEQISGSCAKAPTFGNEGKLFVLSTWLQWYNMSDMRVVTDDFTHYTLVFNTSLLTRTRKGWLFSFTGEPSLGCLDHVTPNNLTSQSEPVWYFTYFQWQLIYDQITSSLCIYMYIIG